MCPVKNCGCGASWEEDNHYDRGAWWEEYNPYHWDWEFQQEIPADPASRTFDWWDAQLIGADGPQLSLGRPGFLLFLGMLGVLFAATGRR